jgi:hypothetical protein
MVIMLAKGANKRCGGLLNAKGQIKQPSAYFRYYVPHRNAQQIVRGVWGGSCNGTLGSNGVEEGVENAFE